MNEQYAPVKLDHFDEIAALLSEDVRWYFVYEAIITAKESLKTGYSLENVPDEKKDLYHYGVRMYFARIITTHILVGQPVEVSENFLEEALEYFAVHSPQDPTYELASYLDYLETWGSSHQDWTAQSPQAFENIDIIISQETI